MDAKKNSRPGSRRTTRKINGARHFANSNLICDRFLLMKTQADFVLLPPPTTWELAEERLDSLPAAPMKVYQEILDRMNSENREFVLKLLGWVYHARRFLTMAELREILRKVIGPKPSDTDDNLQLSAKENVYACRGLIVHNKQTDFVTFSHETVQEFLEKNKM